MIKLGDKISKKYLMGSQYFFKDFPDYTIKDYDYIIIVDNPHLFKTMMNMRNFKDDIFYWKRMTPEEFIEITLKSTPLQIGKFLIPEFCKEINFTIEHLKQLREFAETIDDKHKYQIYIIDSYIENNDFILTQEQLNNAYKIYKKYRCILADK